MEKQEMKAPEEMSVNELHAELFGSEMHVFEKAGLGKAPFFFVGCEKRVYQACHGAPVQPGGSCDYCATGIMYFCWIESSDGKRFKVGSDCVEKTGDAGLIKKARKVVAERAKSVKREKVAAKRAAEKVAREEARMEQMAHYRAEMDAMYPGLSEALKCAHPIVRDIAERANGKYPLSEKQIAIVFKLHAESQKPAEVNVPAPTGRVMVRGRVVSHKVQESQFGRVTKAVVKVETPAGVWLCYGTNPAMSQENTSTRVHAEPGDTVEFVATLEPGKDAHFAFYKRPTKVVVMKGSTK